MIKISRYAQNTFGIWRQMCKFTRICRLLLADIAKRTGLCYNRF